MNSPRLIACYFINGIIKNISPLLVGKGEGEIVDKEIIKDSYGRPYIPATSVIGATRHYLEKNFNIPQKEFYYLFGKLDDYQSHLIVDDLLVRSGFSINVRDGVKIARMGIAEDKKKYDYEIIEPGAEFNFNMELKVREGFEPEKIEEILATMLGSLRDGKIYLGALTTKGFGRVVLTDAKVYKFSFPVDGNDYIKYLTSGILPSERIIDLRCNPLRRINDSEFTLEAEFNIKTSLIIGGGDDADSDRSHIKSDGKAVLTGTSIKGSLRARGEAIVNTLGLSSSIINELFGISDEKTKEKKKSRLIVEETIVEDPREFLHQRIRIDRFTGGVIETGLFNSKPLWRGKVKLNLKIEKPKYEEIGLMLLLLKDLWTEDLPLGGEKSIGRGILRGISARMFYNGKRWMIIRTENGELKIEGDKAELEGYVKALLKRGGDS